MKTEKRQRTLAVIVSLLMAVTTVAAAAPTAVASPSTAARTAVACAPGTTIQTDKGPVCGLSADGVKTWLAVPYAEPPTGELRWAPPRPHAPWTTLLQATATGTPCPQPEFLTPESTDEDCLKLNIAAPADTGRKALPVMVEFHGGGFRLGASSDGAHLARTGNIVHVSVDYRLGILGFLAHRSLGARSGNYALRDQQEALRWVRGNISRFGGDPGNVTIYGASAGGSSVCAQTTSPAAKGLFQKGIAQSGEYNSLLGKDSMWQPQDCKSDLPTLKEAEATGDRFAAAVGCGGAADVAACLRAVPVKTLLEKAGDGIGPDKGTLAPIVDGEILPMSPGEAFARGRVNNVALMHGVDRDEVQLQVANTPEEYEALVREQYGRLAPEVFRRYPLNRFPEPAAFIASRTIVADSNSVCPALLNHERLARRIPVYAFQVDNADAPPMFFLDATKPNGSYHVNEVPFLLAPPGADVSANQRVFATQLVTQWTGFARTGDPTVDGAPYWPRFTRHHPTVMSLAPAGDSQLTEEISKQHNCGFWNKHAPFTR
ncbi:carboxylesterase/lipase family protein [Sphaerimonospora thailandensis]|uniref:Carboxylic ester hydrolase n=1 Tax=Sphaerimonospora thailandensis TaxID=795644 RepID=A0A8J3VXL0_9ACTN|nr:carboxylesterase family protein [Sphaerimonospora thailandensis]GIH68000.1 carboxylic ester hydrolase [Sphaerimonospora thailandensis]